MNPLDIRYWAGTPESLYAYVTAVIHAMESDKAADYFNSDREKDDEPDLYERQGEVGVISIKGSLTNTDSWMNAFTGAVSYNQIREALIYAAEDTNVKAIVLDITSGGGAVSGCSDTAALIKTIDEKVKPVHAFGEGVTASAAYWLASSARSMKVGNTAEIGSIGVVAVHKEMSRMLDQEGITATVIRSGKFKMLGSPYEALSDTAKEVLQAQVDQLAGIFTEHVAGCRKKSMAQVEATMGAGRVFIGQSAVDIGLVDGVTTFDAFMSEIIGGIAFSEKLPQYVGNSLKGPQVATALTDQKIADLTAAPAPEAVAPTPAPDAVVSLLQTQLAAAQAQVLALSIDLKTANDARAASDATAEKLRPIARAAVGSLRVAFNGTAAGVEALTDDVLMAEHANLSAQFTAKFPAGGVAAVSSTGSSEKVGEVTDPVRSARLAATRLS